MENQIFGILTIIISALLFYQSFREYQNEKYEKSLIFILIAGLILRTFTSCDFYLHEWDERYHALVAKNLIDNPLKPMLYVNPILEYDYRNWAENHIWVHKQPVPLYSMALSMYVFGENVIALRIPSILFSTLSILSTYKIGEILYSKKIGLIAAFLFSINGLIIEQTAGRVATDHIDVFFFSFVSFGVYFMLRYSKERKRILLLLGAVLTSLAILSKWLPALIVIPIWLMASLKDMKIKQTLIDLILFLIITTLIVLPWQLYIYTYFPVEAAWESSYNKKHIFEVLGNHGHPFYYHFDKMRIIFGELVYLPLIWLVYKMFKEKFDEKKLVLLIWILIPYLFFSFVKTKMQGYILFTAPAMFIMIGIFLEYLQSIQSKRKLLIKTICILLLVLPIRYSIERIKPFSKKERTSEWISKMKNIANENPDDLKIVFNCKYPIETMFYTDIIAYEAIPNKEKLAELNSNNYTIYIDNGNKIPTEKSKLDFVNYIKITGENKD